MTPLTRFAIIGFLCISLLSATYLILHYFFNPLLWAVIIVYITYPLYSKLNDKLNHRENLSAVLMCGVVFMLFLSPFIWLSYQLQHELTEFYQANLDSLTEKPVLPDNIQLIPYFGQLLQDFFDKFATVEEFLLKQITPLIKRFSSQLINFIGDIGYNMAQLTLTVFISFFLYRDGVLVFNEIKQAGFSLLEERFTLYLNTIQITIKAVLYGIVLTAMGQAAVAGLGYYFVGVHSPIFASMITFFCSLIPFATPLSWGLIALSLLLSGKTLAGIELLLWGVFVVSWVDNIIRPIVISSSTKIPFIIVMLGILGGLMSFGLLGLFIGPVILAIVLAIWREYLARLNL
ncbi:MAG: AI-2E family transporter [Methylococcaceae bacterium]